MLDISAWDEIANQVSTQDFYRVEHQLIFAKITELCDTGRPCDVVTLAEELDRDNSLDEAGGIGYLNRLVNQTPAAANTRAYAAILHEQSIIRQLIRAGNEISEAGYQSNGRKSHELIDHADTLVRQVADQLTREVAGFRSIGRLLSSTIDRIEMLFNRGDELTGVSTGFIDFDAMTSGLQSSDLIIVAGRPAMGKTTFAANIAEYVALKVDLPVAFFSMKMSGAALAMRMISSISRVNHQAVRSGKLEEDERPRVAAAVQTLNDSKMFIDDTPALTPNDLRSRCRRLAKEHGSLGLIVIDNLQMMKLGIDENRTDGISTIVPKIKALSKELGAPVIALSQLSRSVEQRANKHPVISDLRESSALEQVADLIAFIYRDEVYNEESPDKGTAEVTISKQSNGPLGTVKLVFLGHFCRFENFADWIYPIYTDS